MVERATVVRQAYESFLARDLATLMGLLDPAVRWMRDGKIIRFREYVDLDAPFAG